jgi:hypothetical protein
MAKHNPTNDVMARERAVRELADIIAGVGVDLTEDGTGGTAENAGRIASAIVDAMEFVSYDRETANIRGNKVYLRRLVLTTAFETDPDAVRRAAESS